MQAAKLGGYDVVILDTAGRTHIDEPLMAEMAEVKPRPTRTKSCSSPTR
jgi:signal recognition particle subunit SRP54